MKKTIAYLQEKKRCGQKISMLTCYDYPTAVLQEKAGLDVIFVGDSLGPNELGYEREISLSLDEMVHHLRAVRRGVKNAYLLVDMPYKTYENPVMALQTAKRLVDCGADGVKLEGMNADVVSCLHKNGIEVWGHLGFNPQFHEKAAIQGKTFDSAKRLLEDAVALQNAGACMIVLELVPEELGKLITETLAIPTIGIGAGRYTDGQVLVVHDMLGITPYKLRHAKIYGNIGQMMLDAFLMYIHDVEHGGFPQEENVRHMPEAEWKRLSHFFQQQV